MCIQYTRLNRPAPKHASFACFGSVRTPRVWTLDELRELPHESRRVTLVCDAVPLDPRRWHTHEWSGVPLTALLHEAGIMPEAQSLQIAGYDGSLNAFSLAELDGALLALSADGQPLTAEQGYPARLILPGQSACAMPRYVQRIAVSTDRVPALAPVQPRAVITRAVRESGFDGVRLAGWAFGGPQPLESVAVRLDDGPPVFASVTGGAPGLAGAWALDWPGIVTGMLQFTVQPVVDGKAVALQGADKSLARRWKAQAHQVRVGSVS